ncbi:MAG: hydrolase [Spirochaetaceae bacterium]|nr:MAG: hydrolase [Spirochaetaceae bacterium]
MKTILCYGDSNTWGYDPVTKARYDHTQRWTRILQHLLGQEYFVIEEGQNGRTTVHDDPVEGHKNGMTYLLPCLESHKPLDLVVLMLGTNDLKQRFSKPAVDIAWSVSRLVRAIQTSESGPADGAPEVLLLAPPPVARLTGFADMLAGAQEKSRHLGEEYRHVADERGCTFLDTGTIIRSSDVDGVHFDPDQLPLLAEAVHERVTAILG